MSRPRVSWRRRGGRRLRGKDIISLFLKATLCVISDKSQENDFGRSRQEVLYKKGVVKNFA